MASRTQKSEKDLRWGAIYQVVYLLVMFITRVVILKYLGLISLSINNLFTQVISLLSITEAGLSQCVTYRMYKPLAEGNGEKLSEIATFYHRAYQILAVVMFLIGLCLMPFLPKLVTKIEVDWTYLYFVYLVFLANTCAGYLFSSRISILWADQKTFIQAKYNIFFRLAFFLADLVCICIFKNYTAYIIVELLYVIFFFGFMHWKVGELYPSVKEKRDLPKEEQKSLFQDVRRMFIGKISGKVLNSTDNVLISTLVGTNFVGVYGQYSMFQNGFLSLFAQINQAVVGSVGNTLVTESKEYSRHIFDVLTYFFFAAGAFCACCVFVGVNPFLKSIIGKEYLLTTDVVYIISIVLFFEILKMPLFTFFNSAGMFKEEQYISLLSCVINLVVSIILGLRIGMAGIFIGTIISLVIAVYLKAMEIGKKKFDSPFWVEKEMIGYLILFIIELTLCHIATFKISFEIGILEFLVKCLIAGAISLFLSVVPFRSTENFKYWKGYVAKKLKKN